MKSIAELISEPWRREIKWDVSHAEALIRVEDGTFCFDPLLSYETTGYRPITDDQGLDFDPAPFKAVGMKRQNTGAYTDYYPNTTAHKKFWKEQHELSQDGMVHNNYRVTGDHYFFLNFYTMLVAQQGQKAGGGRKRVHPDFWAVHYEWYHYIELAESLGFDCVGLKSRGVGFSEVGACLGVRPYTTNPEYSSLYVASYEPFLTGKGIIQKCWTQLDWLNKNTDGGMRRVRSINQSLHKKAGKMTKQGEEYGHLAQISGQTVDKPDKLRGDRTERIIFEESGSNPCLLDTYSVAEPLVIINGDRVGIRIVFGTGGDTEVIEGKRGSVSGLHGLEQMFLNPRMYKALPYRHPYNNTGDYVETGYFLPAWRTVRQSMDHRGVANEALGKAYYQKTRDLTKSNPDVYSKHCSEYCWTYEEALSRKGSNRFDQMLLAEQRQQIEIHKTVDPPKRGFLQWEYADPKTQTVISGVKFIEHAQGDVEIVEEPIKEHNQVVPNLYVAGIDSIDVGADESIVGDKGSKFCILIKRRTYGMRGSQYVAKYLARPDRVRKAYEIAAMLLWWYNCQANVEATRVSLIGYFRDKGRINMLMRRPKYALQGQSSNRQATNLYGTQASKEMIKYGIDLIVDFIEDHSQSINFLDMIIQLQEYSDEMKGKYDIVAAMQMTEIGDQEMMGITPKAEPEEEWQDVGYYRDARGILRLGIINNDTNGKSKAVPVYETSNNVHGGFQI